MNFESLSPILMIFVRYAISGFGVWLTTKGFSETDVNALMEQVPTIVVGAIIAAGPSIYAALKRPSVKAMETAKAVDKQVPADEPVTIRTPAGVPNIVIPAGPVKQ